MVLRNLSIIATSLLLATQAHASKYYKWVDEDGQVHYSQHAPSNHESKEVKVWGAKSSISSTSSSAVSHSTSPVATQPKAEDIPVAKKDPEACRKAQKNIQSLSTKPIVQDPDGNVMTIDQKNKEIERSKAIADVHCE